MKSIILIFLLSVPFLGFSQQVPKYKYDSVVAVNHKLATELLHKKIIIQNAKYYLNIVNHRPSQQKFLRGWMNRALNQ